VTLTKVVCILCDDDDDDDMLACIYDAIILAEPMRTFTQSYLMNADLRQVAT